MTNPPTQTPPIDRTVPPLRWGILGAARIARKALVGAIRATGGEIVAIGASTLERAQTFAAEHGIPKAYQGYRAVIDDAEVEAVYVPLANGLHFTWAMECARSGCHCLCEKPLVLHEDEARDLRVAFAASGARLLEGFMWRHSPAIDWLIEQVREREIGELRRIHGAFSFALVRPDDYRWRDDQGGGALLDIGTYVVNAARYLFAAEPQVAACRSTPAGNGPTDVSSVGWLDFGQDRLATFECSFDSVWRQELTLTGREGMMRIERPFGGVDAKMQLHIATGDHVNDFQSRPLNPYVGMVAHFTRAARDHSFALWPGEDGVDQVHVMEGLRRSAASNGAPEIL